MKKQTRAEKLADKRIDQAFNRACNGIQIPMLAIPGIFRDVRLNMQAQNLLYGSELTDAQLDELVKSVVDKVRVN